jgi:hypothetical protein
MQRSGIRDSHTSCRALALFEKAGEDQVVLQAQDKTICATGYRHTAARENAVIRE